MALLENFIKIIMDMGVITAKEKLSTSAYKIDIKSDAVKTMDFIPGYFIRLGVGVGQEVSSKKDMVRSYSIWDIAKDKNTISLAIATHSKGIGSQWAENCKVGDIVYYKTKKGKFILDSSADSYLMIGDLSSLSHLYIINRYLPDNKQVESIIYSKDRNELYADTTGKKTFAFYEMEQNDTEKIIAKIDELLPNLTGQKMVHIAGDSRICVALNQYFRKDLNWDSKQIKTKPFWNPEKKGLE